MEKVVDSIFQIFGVFIVVAIIGGYLYLNSSQSNLSLYQEILESKEYLMENEQKYADCHYTLSASGDIKIMGYLSDYYFNPNYDKNKVIEAENKFKNRLKKTCEPVINTYETRYQQYEAEKLDYAISLQTKFEKIMGFEPNVPSEMSDKVGFYERFSPKSLQYPSYTNVKLTFSEVELVNYVTSRSKI